MFFDRSPPPFPSGDTMVAFPLAGLRATTRLLGRGSRPRSRRRSETRHDHQRVRPILALASLGRGAEGPPRSAAPASRTAICAITGQNPSLQLPAFWFGMIRDTITRGRYHRHSPVADYASEAGRSSVNLPPGSRGASPLCMARPLKYRWTSIARNSTKNSWL